MQEKALKILFSSMGDMSQVKSYLVRQWTKIHHGWDKVSLRDYIFSKEVRLGHYAVDQNTGAAKAQPPSAVVAYKAMLYDPMAEPPYRWRVPYVVVHGSPKSLLKDLVVSPEEVLFVDSQLRINHIYYITKCINPALNRCLNLCGVDVNVWYKNMTKPALRLTRHVHHSVLRGPGLSPADATGRKHGRGDGSNKKQMKLDSYFHMSTCACCGADGCAAALCDACYENHDISLNLIYIKLRRCAEINAELSAVCRKCSLHTAFPLCGGIAALDARTNLSVLASRGGLPTGKDGCCSLDCPVFYERCRQLLQLNEIQAGQQEAMGFLNSIYYGSAR